MLLYDHPLSSYCQKVKIAMREKGVPFEAVLPDAFGTGQRDVRFAAANPRGEVPALLVDGNTIFDSTIIMEFLEDSWPQPALLPSDPLARAFARETEEVCDTHYEAVNWGFGEILWFQRATGALYQPAVILTYEDGFWWLSARSVRSGDVVHRNEDAT